MKKFYKPRLAIEQIR